jgi:hypothetical protein
MLTQIINAEEQLNALLPAQRPAGKPPAGLLAAARAWSGLAWAEGLRLGPMPLTEKQVEDGLQLAGQAVFICGVHRSGTTLVRNLLDGHPNLCVLPSEGTFYTNLEHQLKQLPPANWAAHIGTEWLRRFANPINQPPYWLLGSSTEDASPYVDFARYLLSWWQAVEQKPGTQWPHMAVVLAYASCTGMLPARYWVDKTPTNERFLDRIRKELPNVRIVHVIREPLATIASRKVMEPGAALKGALRALKVSYQIAHREIAAKEQDHLLVRYEELCMKPDLVTGQIASFLGVRNLPILGRVTVAGISAKANSSFNKDAASGEILKPGGREQSVLTPSEQKLISAYLGNDAAKLGYALPKAGLLSTAWLRLKNKLII